ncbi:MAG: DUF1761 domain-containing protein [Patescibacteria group bacterium]
MGITINFWAVLVSAVASMVIGSVWYGPIFGKVFTRAMGMDKKTPEEMAAMSASGGSASGGKKGMGLTYAWQFVVSVVMFYVLAWLVGALDSLTLAGGIKTALYVWFGFVLPVKFGDALWGGKMVLFWLGAGNMLLTLLAAGAIIGSW